MLSVLLQKMHFSILEKKICIPKLVYQEFFFLMVSCRSLILSCSRLFLTLNSSVIHNKKNSFIGQISWFFPLRDNMASRTENCHDVCPNPLTKPHARSTIEKLAKLITLHSTTTVAKCEQIYRKILRNHISLIQSPQPRRMPQLLQSGICHLLTTPVIISLY